MLVLALLAGWHEGMTVFQMIVQIAWVLGSIDEGRGEHVHDSQRPVARKVAESNAFLSADEKIQYK